MHGLTDFGTNVPAFLVKLWELVGDSETDELICWSKGGNSFVISGQAQFARDLLPLYFKHSNMTSFIRQLNMYGFHKVPSLDAGSLKCEKDEMEFAHPYFVKDHPYLVGSIKRKLSANKPTVTLDKSSTAALGNMSGETLAKVLSDVNTLKSRQESWDARLAAMKRENEALWRELAVFRQKHMKQEQIINKLIHFIVTIVQPSRNPHLRRRFPLMLNGAVKKMNKVDTGERSPTGPTIHEIDPVEVLQPVPSSSTSSSTDNTEFIASDLIGSEFMLVTSPKSNSSVGPAGEPPDSPLPTTWLEQSLTEDNHLGTNPLTPVNPADVNPAGAAAACLQDSGVQSPLLISVPCDVSSNKRKRKRTGTGKQMSCQKTIDKTAESDIYVTLLEDSSPNTLVQSSFDFVTEAELNANEVPDEATADPSRCDSVSAQKDAQEQSPSDDSMAVVKQSSFVDDLSRYHAVPQDLQGHVDSVQGEIDLFKEMLKGDGYSLDANTLLGLFNDDPLAYDIPLSNNEEPKDKENGTGSELMTYGAPNLLDLVDLYGSSSSNTEWCNVPSPGPLSPLPELATPLVLSPTPPAFPTPPGKRRKK